jgi:hypothetical protein
MAANADINELPRKPKDMPSKGMPMGADELAARARAEALAKKARQEATRMPETPVQLTPAQQEAVKSAQQEKERKQMGVAYDKAMQTHKKGGVIGSASKRADGIAQSGKTKGRYL